MTSTREAADVILSAYLRVNRGRNVAGISDPAAMDVEIGRFGEHVRIYPVDALYGYRGADVPLDKCPHEDAHEDAMRRVAERYETVGDLEKPAKSAALVEIVTGLRPDFCLRFNERGAHEASAMLETLAGADTSRRSCGNTLVQRCCRSSSTLPRTGYAEPVLR